MMSLRTLQHGAAVPDIHRHLNLVLRGQTRSMTQRQWTQWPLTEFSTATMHNLFDDCLVFPWLATCGAFTNFIRCALLVHGYAHFGVAGAFVGPVAHDVSTLANHVSTAFCSILQGRARCLNFRELFDVSFNISFRDKFSGCSHPSNVFPHFATLLQDVQLVRKVTPCLTCVLREFILVCFINSYAWCALTHPTLDQIPTRVATTSEQDSSILMSVGPPPFSGKELPAVTFDVDHVYVLSRPRWTRCMSRTAAAPKWQLSGT